MESRNQHGLLLILLLSTFLLSSLALVIVEETNNNKSSLESNETETSIQTSLKNNSTDEADKQYLVTIPETCAIITCHRRQPYCCKGYHCSITLLTGLGFCIFDGPTHRPLHGHGGGSSFSMPGSEGHHESSESHHES